VRDNGPGLDTDNPLSLFAPQRGRRKRSSNGHGLGLSIVQRIISRLGGTVDAENIAGGSCFSFTLPAASTTSRMG
jgi:signal transduction histidine kinase